MLEGGLNQTKKNGGFDQPSSIILLNSTCYECTNFFQRKKAIFIFLVAWGLIYLFFSFHLIHLSILFSLFFFSFARGNMIYYSFLFSCIMLLLEEFLSCYGVAAVSNLSLRKNCYFLI
jgi:hypothetical protein